VFITFWTCTGVFRKLVDTETLFREGGREEEEERERERDQSKVTSMSFRNVFHRKNETFLYPYIFCHLFLIPKCFSVPNKISDFCIMKIINA